MMSGEHSALFQVTLEIVAKPKFNLKYHMNDLFLIDIIRMCMINTRVSVIFKMLQKFFFK